MTTFSVYLVVRTLERRGARSEQRRTELAWDEPPERRPVTPGVALLPVLAYLAMMASDVLAPGAPPALVVIGPFTMGLPALVAVARLVDASRSAGRVEPSA